MLSPLVVVLADNPGHNHMRDSHGTTTKNGKLATTNPVKEQECRDPGDELADVDHAAENEGHFVTLTKSSEEDGSVVNESVDA